MSDERLQREFLRAPLKSWVLYVDGEHVFKARTLNISEGGLLMSEFPHVPDGEMLPVAINLVHYPRFQGMDPEELKQLSLDDLERTILKTKVKIVRSFENRSNVDLVFINIGTEFFDLTPEFKSTVTEYVETFTKNIVYLLSLFESLGKKTDQTEMLRMIADLLGYDRRMKIPLLRAKVLHDYQSLESL